MTLKRSTKFFISLAAALLALFLLSGLTTWPRDILQKPLVVNEAARPSDVIIVLGSGTKKGPAFSDHMPRQAKQRVLAGNLTYLQGLAPRVLMAGGLNKKTGLVEADVMTSYAVTHGLTRDVIFQEPDSKDTWQNAQGSIVIMKKNGWKTAIVVTSPYHTWRACRMFRKQQADVRCVAAPFSLVPANSFLERVMDTKSVVREYGAIVYNWMKGQL